MRDLLIPILLYYSFLFKGYVLMRLYDVFCSILLGKGRQLKCLDNGTEPFVREWH